MEQFLNLAGITDIEKSDLLVINSSTRHALIKEVLRKSMTTEDVVGSFLVIYDFFTMIDNIKGVRSNRESNLFISYLIDRSDTFAELKDNLYKDISDPFLLKEIDGFLTVKFNELAGKINPEISMRASSILNNLGEIIALEESIEKEVCLVSLNILFDTLKRSVKKLLEDVIKDGNVKGDTITDTELIDQVVQLSDAYNCIDPTTTLWLPVFLNEVVVVFNKQHTVKSFTSYVNKFFESKDPKFDIKDYDWLKVIEDLLDNKLSPDFNLNRQCRIYVNDPYSEIKEYKLIIPVTGKPILTR